MDDVESREHWMEKRPIAPGSDPGRLCLPITEDVDQTRFVRVREVLDPEMGPTEILNGDMA